jgi:small nuclear ribonucleoprotein (snRNP)-like protein
MEPQVILPPVIDEVPPPGLAIVEELDKTLLVQLRDGRKIIGILRSFDQFANLVLEGAHCSRGTAPRCGTTRQLHILIFDRRIIFGQQVCC